MKIQALIVARASCVSSATLRWRAPATRFSARSRRSSGKISRRSSPRPAIGAVAIGAGKSADALALAREALIARRKLEPSYAKADGVATKRTVRPLGIFFWGRTWTLAAWCDLRQDFRNFAIDRVTASTMLHETFEDEAGKTLRDMLARTDPKRSADRQLSP